MGGQTTIRLLFLSVELFPRALTRVSDGIFVHKSLTNADQHNISVKGTNVNLDSKQVPIVVCVD